ncbi:exonuclease RNase T and DNA polymerase III [Infundibulicybe gibba]|nr:exonuclease RNase T and DNA polymerase III [Infundibulicybe gibba]
MHLQYLLILDFEATCGDAIPPKEQEIIEFPTLLYNTQRRVVESTFHSYVQPTRHPRLTEFCTTLTGITQEVVDKAPTFPTVWAQFNEFLQTHGVFSDPGKHVFLSCGHWDLQTMLPKQLALENLGPPGPAFETWINVKTSFRKFYGGRNNVGMAGMLNKLKIPLEGRHHSGIDDCKNICRIVQRMQEDGWEASGKDIFPK